MGLRAIIKPQDGLNRIRQLGGQTDTAFADAIGAAIENFLREGDAEGLLHRSDRPAELDRAPLGLGRALLDRKPEFLRKSLHQLDGCRISTVLLAILGTCEPVFAQAIGFERILALHDHGNSEDAGGGRRLLAGCRG